MNLDLEKLELYLQYCETFGAGLSLSIALNRKQIFSKSFGLANRKTEQKITPNHLFNIGSITNHITATRVIQLVEENKISLYTTVGEIIRDSQFEISEYVKNLNFLQLLTHSTGLPIFVSKQFENREEFLSDILRSEFKGNPGTGFKMSNAALSLVAALLEIIENKPYDDQIISMFKNAGLEEPKFVGDILITKMEDTVSYGSTGASYNELSTQHYSWKYRGQEGVALSSSQLLKWIIALLSGKVISETGLDQLLPSEPYNNNYSLGWYQHSDGNNIIIEHGGNTFTGFNGVVKIHKFGKDHEVIITLLSNTAVNGSFLAFQIISKIQSILGLKIYKNNGFQYSNSFPDLDKWNMVKDQIDEQQVDEFVKLDFGIGDKIFKIKSFSHQYIMEPISVKAKYFMYSTCPGNINVEGMVERIFSAIDAGRTGDWNEFKELTNESVFDYFQPQFAPLVEQYGAELDFLYFVNSFLPNDGFEIILIFELTWYSSEYRELKVTFGVDNTGKVVQISANYQPKLDYWLKPARYENQEDRTKYGEMLTKFYGYNFSADQLIYLDLENNEIELL